MPLTPEEIKTDDYAIVFSGGGALGSWEVGCLRAVIEHHEGLWPRVVTGASAGALNAAGLCAGLTPDDLEEKWTNLTNESVYRSNLKLGWLATKAAWWFSSGWVKSKFGGSNTAIDKLKSEFRGVTGVFDTSPFAATLDKILKGREHCFLASPIRLAISTTKLADGEVELFYKMPSSEVLPANASKGRFAKSWNKIDGLPELKQALIGTTALPLLFPPMAGRFDGGVLMNQPISPAIRLGAKRVYVFIPNPQVYHPTENLWSIGQTMATNWLSQSLETQIRNVGMSNWVNHEFLKLFPAGQQDSQKAKNLRKRLIELCVVRPSDELQKEPGVGLLSFGKDVSVLVAAAEQSCKERLKRFDSNNPKTWDGYMRNAGELL